MLEIYRASFSFYFFRLEHSLCKKWEWQSKSELVGHLYARSTRKTLRAILCKQPRYSCPVCISLCTQQRLGLQGLRMLKVSQKRPLWGDQSCRAKRQQCAKMCQISMCTLDWQIKGWKRSPRGAVLKKLQTLQDALADFLCGWLTEYQRTLKYFVKCWPQLLMTDSYSVFRSELWTKHFGESRLVEDTVKRAKFHSSQSIVIN